MGTDTNSGDQTPETTQYLQLRQYLDTFMEVMKEYSEHVRRGLVIGFKNGDKIEGLVVVYRGENAETLYQQCLGAINPNLIKDLTRGN